MQQEVPVNVFWDIENCAVPATMKGVQVVNAIRSFALQRGILKNISAFANLKLIKDDLRSDLQESGVLLHDVTRKANSSDLAILVEILKLVIDNKPPHCIVLISGDRDFANVLSTLTFRKYQVYLIHSPQASEVLRNAATEAFEWTQLLKRGGDTSLTPLPMSPPNGQGVAAGGNPMQSLSAPFDKFQPLLDFLAQKGKPQVEFSELGNLIPFTKYGYPKLKDFILDAQSAGLVKCGANKNIHWVSLLNSPNNHTGSIQPSPGQAVNGSVSIVSRAPTDRRQVVKYLLAALDSLKKDYFKPTEGTLQKRVKQMALPLQKIDWEEVVSIAKAHFFIVEGEKPNRYIYPPTGPFDGVDPSHPNPDKFSSGLWKSLQQFFLSVHPVVRVGRYGFAVFLKEEGPIEVREMPLGSVTELVQLALHRHLLKYHKTQVSTMLPMEMHEEGGYATDNNHNYYGSMSEDLRSPSPLMDGADEGQLMLDDFCYDDERTPLVGITFVWAYSGTSVLVTGSFFNWRNTIALHQRTEKEPAFYNGAPSPSASFASITSIISSSSNNNNIGNNGGNIGGKVVDPEDIFSTVLYLPPGKYEYKFIVDGAWHYDPRQPVVTDESGNLNNFVVVEPLPSRVVEPLLNDDYSY